MNLFSSMTKCEKLFVTHKYALGNILPGNANFEKIGNPQSVPIMCPVYKFDKLTLDKFVNLDLTINGIADQLKI